MPSMINGNATATLISNTNINGVPTLVSELHIIADQASTVTCTSEIAGSAYSIMFNVSGIVWINLYTNARYILLWQGVIYTIHSFKLAILRVTILLILVIL